MGPVLLVDQLTGSGRWLPFCTPWTQQQSCGNEYRLGSPLRCARSRVIRESDLEVHGAQCRTEEEASVIVLQIVSSFFFPSMALTVWVGTAFSMCSVFHQIGSRGRRSSSSDGGP